jgi:hypothetical protein
MLLRERLDFLDIITDVATHSPHDASGGGASPARYQPEADGDDVG